MELTHDYEHNYIDFSQHRRRGSKCRVRVWQRHNESPLLLCAQSKPVQQGTCMSIAAGFIAADVLLEHFRPRVNRPNPITMLLAYTDELGNELSCHRVEFNNWRLDRGKFWSELRVARLQRISSDEVQRLTHASRVAQAQPFATALGARY